MLESSLPHLILTATIIIVSCILYFIGKRSLDQIREEKEGKINEYIDKSLESLIERISPRIIYCSSIEDVRYEASTLIRNTAEQYEAAVQNNNLSSREGNHDKYIDLSEFYIVFYGAAALINESEAGIHLSEVNRKETIENYKSAIKKAADSNVPIRRYVSLLTDAEMELRSVSVRTEYVGWLESQISLLKADPNYTLIITPRAPQWGSSSTSLIVSTGILEIKGHGRSGIAVYDGRMSAKVRYSMKTDIYAGISKNRIEVNGKNAESMTEFLSSFDSIKEIHVKLEGAD